MKASVTKFLVEPLAGLKSWIENSFPQAIVRFFTLDSAQSYQGYFLLLIGIIISLSIVLVKIGTPVITSFMHSDVMILLDSGWRIINGQIPNVDYYNPLGPLTGWLVAFGMKVTSPSASSIAYGNVLLFMILTPWAWFIARSRVSAINAFIFALFMGVLLVTPRSLSTPIREITYAMLYNRHAFVLLSMLSIEVFISPRTSVKPRFLLSGLSSGILLALLFVCKINFFIIGAVSCLLSIILFRYKKIWLISFLASLAIAWLGIHIFFNFNVFSYLSDIFLATKAHDKIQRLYTLKGVFQANLPWLYLIFVLIAICAIDRSSKDGRRDVVCNRTKVQIVVLFLAFSGVILSGTSAQITDIPLFFVAALILLEYLRRECQLDCYLIDSFSGLKYFVTILIVMLFFGGIFLQDISNISLAVMSNQLKSSSLAQSQRLPSKTLSNLIFTGEASGYPKTLKDGLVLLRRHFSTDNRVLVFDSHTNLFSFALELPPPKGDASWWHSNYSFSKKNFPNPERVFKEVNQVIVPRSSAESNSEVNPVIVLKSSAEDNSASISMQEIYGDYLKKHFIEKDKSQFWTLFVKR
jgi:hypothetical protein